MTICYRTHALQRYTATFGISHNLCASYLFIIFYIYYNIYKIRIYIHKIIRLCLPESGFPNVAV